MLRSLQIVVVASPLTPLAQIAADTFHENCTFGDAGDEPSMTSMPEFFFVVQSTELSRVKAKIGIDDNHEQPTHWTNFWQLPIRYLKTFQKISEDEPNISIGQTNGLIVGRAMKTVSLIEYPKGDEGRFEARVMFTRKNGEEDVALIPMHDNAWWLTFQLLYPILHDISWREFYHNNPEVIKAWENQKSAKELFAQSLTTVVLEKAKKPNEDC